MKKAITFFTAITALIFTVNAQTTSKTIKFSSTVTLTSAKSDDSIAKVTKYDRFIGKCAKGQTFVVSTSTPSTTGTTCIDVVYSSSICCESIQIDSKKFNITNVYEQNGKVKAVMYIKATGETFSQELAEL